MVQGSHSCPSLHDGVSRRDPKSCLPSGHLYSGGAVPVPWLPRLHTRFGPNLLAPVLLCVGLFRLTLREDCGHADPSRLKKCPCPTNMWKQAWSLHWGSTLQFARPPCGHCLLERCHHPRGGRQVWPPLGQPSTASASRLDSGSPRWAALAG